ncbi:hypothetical protein MASR2M79_25110 [Aminivibrio sp.]
MGKYSFTADFKLEAVKRVERTGETVAKVAGELELMSTRSMAGYSVIVNSRTALSGERKIKS